MKRFVSIMVVLFILVTTAVNYAYAAKNESVFLGCAEELKTLGIMNGDPNGDMRLNDGLTRAEATALIIRAYGYDADTFDVGGIDFTDMDGHWAYKEVAFAKAAGLIDGMGETTFEPDKYITIQEFIKMTITLIGYKPKAEVQGGYPHGYLMTADALGLLDGIETETANVALRKEAAMIISNTLDVPLMQQTGFGSSEEFTVMDGENDTQLLTLRIICGGDRAKDK